MTWIRLQHPNVVPLMGFTIKPLPSLISPWYERGNIRNYLELHFGANRLKLVRSIRPIRPFLFLICTLTKLRAHTDIRRCKGS